MNVSKTSLKGVWLIEPQVFEDTRGFFIETYNKHRYSEKEISSEFVQDIMSSSLKGTLRGLHYQYPNPQAKLVQVIQGAVIDVAVDIRRGSPDFGKWVGVELSSENRHQLYIPEGFAHGFCVLSETALFHYKCSDFYSPEDEKGVLWSDSELGIDWPVNGPLLSMKDSAYHPLKEIPEGHLPIYRGKS